MKDNSKIILEMVMVFLCGIMDRDIKVSGLMVQKMDMGYGNH